MTTCTNSAIVKEMAGVFKALGDANRLTICYILANDASGKIGVSDLASILGISPSAVSQHMKTLKSARIVESRKAGYHVYFSFDREMMSRYRENFEILYGMVMEKRDQEPSD
jgi:DNA-binding transcriptional ArsR family regulator